jgi:hypothetical protein
VGGEKGREYQTRVDVSINCKTEKKELGEHLGYAVPPTVIGHNVSTP